MILGRPHRSAKACVLALSLAAQPIAALADATGPFYERSFVLAAHDKCRLFQPGVASALTTSALQARGAAIRAGASDADLRATAGRARARADRTLCGDPDLGVVRQRVTTAFAGWAQTRRMTFPGEWSANRSAFASPTWRLMQASTTGASPVRFGIAAGGDDAAGLKAVVSFVGRPRPYAARIVMRDPGQSPRPWLVGSAPALPPEAARRAFFSAGSLAAAPTLLAADRRQGEAWLFPAQTADALARLDPREPFVVEFMFRDDSIARATFQAGDFAAAQAFVAMGSL